MFKRIILVGLVLFSASCVTEQKREITGLDYNFTQELEITLETEEYLSVRFVEVNERGDFLVTGHRDKVFLFNGSGEKIRDLGENARKAHPGLNWSPNRAIFLPDGSIFVQNNAPWGIYFDEKGQYHRTAPSEFNVSIRFTAGAGNIFYSMDITPQGGFIRKLNANGDELGRFEEIPDSFINLMQRYRVGNQFVADDQYLFFTMAAEPALFRLDFQEGELNRYEQPPEYVKRAGGDISSLQHVGPSGLAEEISNFTDNYTVSYSLHRFTDQLLLIQYRNRRDVVNGKPGFGIQLVTKDGKFPMETDLLTDEWVVAAANGKIYTMVQQDEAYSLPRLNVYRLKDLFMDKYEDE